MAHCREDALQQRQIIRIGDDVPEFIRAPFIFADRGARFSIGANIRPFIIAAAVESLRACFVVLLVAVRISIFLDNIARAEQLYPSHFTTMRSLIRTEQGLGDFGRSEEGRQGQEMSYVRFPRFVP